ncbi:hypothetical protein [Paraglaciecola marina]|uniref:hypothetical protein n=1 Tax=Paraglaciecola marina TaxID=2500157 RepID=UPI001060E513|nr:hypothetical protein [Paraglaciecola marina]
MGYKFISNSTQIETYLYENKMSNEEIKLEDKIRFGLEPDNPTLLKKYLRVDNRLLVNQKRALLLSHFNLLLDTAADEYLPLHWRTQCYDHIHQPLFSLQRITRSVSEKSELARLFKELRIMGHYLFH